MHGLRRKKLIKLLGLVTLIISIDQLSKFFVSKNLPATAGGFLQKTCNVNIAWSLPLEGVLLVAIWALAFLAILYIAKKYLWNTFLILVIAGAISNAIDRLQYGCVIDFISIGSFPIFNIADIFISLGVILFVFSIFKQDKTA